MNRAVTVGSNPRAGVPARGQCDDLDRPYT